MTTYKYLSSDVVAVIDDDGISRMSGLASAVVPEGTEILPADPIPVTYQPLTAWQIRKVLNAHGLREQVEAAVAQSDQNTKDAWEFASSYERDNEILIGLATALGLTSEQLDAMFVEGATL